MILSRPVGMRHARIDLWLRVKAALRYIATRNVVFPASGGEVCKNRRLEDALLMRNVLF
jgi:hypothetical protein